MAKAASRKLKVFQAQIGFFDTVVAAPSRAAALRAWGVRQDLFAENLAYPTEDPDAVRAALAHPEIPLKRPAGGSDPFEVEPGGLPQPPAEPKSGKAAKAHAKARPEPEPEPPPPDRSALDQAEAALRDLDERRREQEAAMRRRRAALEAEADKAERAYLEERRKASAALVAAREAWRKAGGRD
jgi:hypothetical protein